MDRRPPEPQSTEQLIQQAQQARQELSVSIDLLRERLDAPRRIVRTISSRPVLLLAGSLVAGLGASLLLRRRSKAVAAPPTAPAATGPFGSKGLLGLFLTVATPVAKVWFTRKLGEWLSQRSLPVESPFQIEPSPPAGNVRTQGP